MPRGFASGEAAAYMELAPDSIYLAAANQSLTRLFGGYSSPKRLQRHKWGLDPHARGSRSYWTQGNTHR
jgi:hypothetical protein